MKILFSDNTLWGLVNFRGDIINHFLKRGCEVVLVAPLEEDAQMRASIPLGVKFIPVKMGRASKGLKANLNYFCEIISIYRKEKPDYVFHYTIKPNIFGTIAAHILHIRSTAMMTGLGYIFVNDSLTNRFARQLYRFGLHFTDHLFLLNEANRKMVIEKHFCNPKKIIMLKGGEGINLTTFPCYDNHSNNITFLYIGRILYDKGYTEFVEAAREVKKQYPEVNFEMVGSLDPTYPKHVPQEVLKKDEEEVGIIYRGFTNDVASIYKRKGIVITLPSYTEGMSRTLMEACAAGKPIIASNIPGCAPMVDDGQNGFLVEPRSAKSLEEAFIRYIQLSSTQKDDFAKHSRKLSEEKFSVEKVITKYNEIVE